MTPARAIALAIAALVARRRILAPLGNLATRFGATTPAAVSAAQEREQISEAIKVLEGMKTNNRSEHG